MRRMTRQDFLAEGAVVTAGVLGAAALGTVALPKVSEASDVTFVESSCGNARGPAGNNGRVLVAYASKFGSTGGVAEAVGKAFCEVGTAADVRLIDNVTDVEPYKAVVIGSAIQRKQWLSEAIEFVENHKAALQQKPVAYFLACLTIQGDPPKIVTKIAKTYMDPVYETAPEIKPVDVGLFAGVLDYGKMNIIFRTIMCHKMKEYGVTEGDYRNWEAIRNWSVAVHSKMKVLEAKKQAAG